VYRINYKYYLSTISIYVYVYDNKINNRKYKMYINNKNNNNMEQYMRYITLKD